jgi:hypothetical protein
MFGIGQGAGKTAKEKDAPIEKACQTESRVYGIAAWLTLLGVTSASGPLSPPFVSSEGRNSIPEARSHLRITCRFDPLPFSGSGGADSEIRGFASLVTNHFALGCILRDLSCNKGKNDQVAAGTLNP